MNEELEIPQTWIFDAHLLDEGWKQPRVSSVCATGSIVAKKISDEEMEKLAQDEKLEVLEPKKGTKPRVYYKNLYRYNSCFIGGSVFANQDNIIDCIQDADVTLKRNTEVIAEIKTDIFGDFKFDKLAEGSGDYQIEINADGFKKKTINIVLDESVTLEDIQLSK